MPRILLDQNVPRRLREHLPGYGVETAARRGWSEFANGELIRAAEAAGFDCIVTADRNLRYHISKISRAARSPSSRSAPTGT
jgi:predicted nuclease of predicted toxin-antitoxin system